MIPPPIQSITINTNIDAFNLLKAANVAVLMVNGSSEDENMSTLRRVFVYVPIQEVIQHVMDPFFGGI